jgi:hypothetical protein
LTALPGQSEPISGHLAQPLAIGHDCCEGLSFIQGRGMGRIIPSVVAVTATLALSLSAQAASLTRTFVSAAGLDTNPCTVTAPCRTFAAAYTATAPNGIVAALDPAGYGSFTITGPVTIDGHGWAAITMPEGGRGIVVNAGASDTVLLRGLIVDGGGNGGPHSEGILFNSGGSLTVDGCVVRNLPHGMDFNANATTAVSLAISNSYFENYTTGLAISNSNSGALTVAISRTAFNNGNYGLSVYGYDTGPVAVAVTDSIAANNAYNGFLVNTTYGRQPVSNLTLTNVQAVNNSGIGIQASGTNATLWLAHSTVAGNASGFSADTSGVINSFGNNYFADNGANTGSLTPVGPQ